MKSNSSITNSPSLSAKALTVRVKGKLKELVTISDEQGNILQKILSPLMIEMYPRDIMQIIVGACILALPLAFTQETWEIGSSLPNENILAIMFISIFLTATFVYYNIYKTHLKNHWRSFIKRVITTYLLAFLVAGFILTLIDVAPWQTDVILALKRTILIALPASMSASVADVIK
jgi:uncharacterized membrane protein